MVDDWLTEYPTFLAKQNIYGARKLAMFRFVDKSPRGGNSSILGLGSDSDNMNHFGILLKWRFRFCRSGQVWRFAFVQGDAGASIVAQLVKNPPAMQETQVQSLGWEDPLEEEMATNSSILAWRIPWTEEPGGLQSIRHDLVTKPPRWCWWFWLQTTLKELLLHENILRQTLDIYHFISIYFISLKRTLNQFSFRGYWFSLIRYHVVK